MFAANDSTGICISGTASGRKEGMGVSHKGIRALRKVCFGMTDKAGDEFTAADKTSCFPQDSRDEPATARGICNGFKIRQFLYFDAPIDGRPLQIFNRFKGGRFSAYTFNCRPVNLGALRSLRKTKSPLSRPSCRSGRPFDFRLKSKRLPWTSIRRNSADCCRTGKGTESGTGW